MFRGRKLCIGESRDSHPGVHGERSLLTQHSTPPKRMHHVFRTTFSLCCAATSPTSCPRSRAARDRLMPAPQRRDNHRRHPASRVHASRPGTATREILGKPKTKPLSRQGTEADPSMQRRPQPPARALRFSKQAVPAVFPNPLDAPCPWRSWARGCRQKILLSPSFWTLWKTGFHVAWRVASGAWQRPDYCVGPNWWGSLGCQPHQRWGTAPI